VPENKAKAPDSLVLPFAELKTGRPVDKEQYQLRPLGAIILCCISVPAFTKTPSPKNR